MLRLPQACSLSNLTTLVTKVLFEHNESMFTLSMVCLLSYENVYLDGVCWFTVHM